jgi:predicted phosphodiesterase
MALTDIIRDTKMKKTRPSYETTVALYDIHAPYVSPEATKVATQYIADTKPRRVILGGDLIDNPAMSLFPQDADHKMDTREEIDYAVQWLAGVLASSPDSEIVVIDGNHDTARFERVKSEESKALKNLRGMDFFSQLKASYEEAGIPNPLVYSKKKYELGPGMVFVHGDPRMTPEILGGVNGAKRTADSSAFPGCHVVYGHEHTIGQAASKWGDRSVFKVGAMMDVNTKHYTHMAQYQNGFLVVHYNPNVRPEPTYHVQNVHIQNGTAIVDGTEYTAGRKHR